MKPPIVINNPHIVLKVSLFILSDLKGAFDTNLAKGNPIINFNKILNIILDYFLNLIKMKHK